MKHAFSGDARGLPCAGTGLRCAAMNALTPLAMQVLRWMVALQNPSDPNLQITPEVAAEYPAIAQEIADAAEANPLLGAPRETAALITEWAQHESRFKRVPCGPKWDCDAGSSLGLLQVSQFWIRRGYVPDASVASALRLMHESFRVCKSRPLAERMAWYAAGGATCDRRLELSRTRMRAAKALANDSQAR